VLADPWNPPVSIPTQFLQHLTYLSFLAEGLLVTHLASQFCEALVQLKQLEELQLSRLQLSAPAAQMMAQSLTELPKLNTLGLSGGATPMHMAELYVLLNGEVAGGAVPFTVALPAHVDTCQPDRWLLDTLSVSHVAPQFV